MEQNNQEDEESDNGPDDCIYNMFELLQFLIS